MGAAERFKRSLGLVPPSSGGGLGPARVRDALGRVLEVGDEVLLISPATMMRIASISRVLDPGAPPNMMLVTMVARIGTGVGCDQALNDVFFTRHAAEMKDGFLGDVPKADPPQDEPPAGDPPQDNRAVEESQKPSTIILP